MPVFKTGAFNRSATPPGGADHSTCPRIPMENPCKRRVQKPMPEPSGVAVVARFSNGSPHMFSIAASTE